MVDTTSTVIYFSLVIAGMVLTMLLPHLFQEPRRNQGRQRHAFGNFHSTRLSSESAESEKAKAYPSVVEIQSENKNAATLIHSPTVTRK